MRTVDPQLNDMDENVDTDSASSHDEEDEEDDDLDTRDTAHEPVLEHEADRYLLNTLHRCMDKTLGAVPHTRHRVALMAEKAKKFDDLKKENTALTRQVKQLQASQHNTKRAKRTIAHENKELRRETKAAISQAEQAQTELKANVEKQSTHAHRKEVHALHTLLPFYCAIVS